MIKTVPKIILSLSILVSPMVAHAQSRSAGFAEVNGTKLYYEQMGKGRTIVFVHGGLVDSRVWDDQFREFAKRYRVIRNDLRGFGKSELDWSREELARMHNERLLNRASLGDLPASEGLLVVVNSGEDTIAFVDLAHPEQPQKISTRRHPQDIVASPNGTVAYVAEMGNFTSQTSTQELSA